MRKLQYLAESDRMVPEKQIYTTAEACAILCCHKSTLDKWVREGKIKRFKAGHHYRYHAFELREFLGLGPDEPLGIIDANYGKTAPGTR